MAVQLLGERQISQKSTSDHRHVPVLGLPLAPHASRTSPPPPQGAQPTGASHFLKTSVTLQMQLKGHLLQEAFFDNPTARLGGEELQGTDDIHCPHLSV